MLHSKVKRSRLSFSGSIPNKRISRARVGQSINGAVGGVSDGVEAIDTLRLIGRHGEPLGRAEASQGAPVARGGPRSAGVRTPGLARGKLGESLGHDSTRAALERSTMERPPKRAAST